MKSSFEILQEMQRQHLPRFPKFAALTESKKTFEQNFYMLTDAIVNEKFQSLKPYDLGFQLIDKSDDNTKALGIRAFRLKTLAFMPFFYDNGQVYGHEMFFLPAKNLFVPSTEAWVNDLVTKSTDEAGEVLDVAYSRNLSSFADLMPLRRPIMFKMSNAKTLLERWKERLPSKRGYLVPKAIENIKLAKALLSVATYFPAIVTKINNLYGQQLLKKAEKVATTPIPPKVALPVKLAEKSLLRFYTDPEEAFELSPQQRLELLKKGYYIIDERPEEIFSEVVPQIGPAVFIGVSEPGCYVVLDRELDKRTVVIVRDVQDGKFYIINQGKAYENILTSGGRHIPQGRGALAQSRIEAVEKLSDAEFHQELNKLDKWDVEKLNNPTKRKRFSILIVDAFGNAVRVHYFEGPDGELTPNCRISQGYGTTLVVGARTDVMTRDIILPAEYRVVEVEESEPFYVSGYLDLMVRQQSGGFQNIKISCHNDEYIIDNKRLTKIAALRYLMENYYLREQDAKRMLLDSELGKVTRYLVKKAAPVDFPFAFAGKEQPSVAFPGDLGIDFAPGYPGRAYYEVDVQIVGIKPPRPPELRMPPPPAKVYDTLRQLAQMNEGEVFDLGLLSSLLFAAQDTSLIDKYLPRLMLGLDGLGRILFVLYRHKDELREKRYGESDYDKIVDDVKTNFENLGDLILDLSQQGIGPLLRGIGMSESDVEDLSIGV